MGQNQARNQFFCHFLKFSSLISLEIPYSDRMQQCITSTRGKPTREIFGDQIWVKRTKISPKIRFFAIFSNLIHQFFFKLHKMIAQNNVKLLVELKPAKKLGGSHLGQTGQNQTQNQIFWSFFRVWFISFSGNCIG